MKSICAWCGKIIEAGMDSDPDAKVSHGICKVCKEDFRAELRALKGETMIPLDTYHT